MIPTYNSIDELWNTALSDLNAHGKRSESRTGPMVEVLGWAGCLANPTQNFLANSRRAISPAYAASETLWYLSRKNTVEALLPYAPQYERYLDDGVAYGAYGYRIAHNYQYADQLKMAETLLRGKPETRQCIVQMWRAEDAHMATTAEMKDLPCTCHWQFFVRDGSLHMEACMRSNDVWLGMPYDVFVFTTIQQLLANTLGLKIGQYVHKVGSLHLYDKNAIAASEVIVIEQTLEHGYRTDDSTLREGENAVGAELALRTHNQLDIEWLNDDPQLEPLCRDLVLCCGVHLNRWDASYVHSPALRQGLEIWRNRRGRAQ